MNLVFYYSPMSTATITELVIEELNIPCKRIKMDLAAKETRKPEFLKLNPNGMVPLIVHNDQPIWESAAITMYLGENFGVERGLYPDLGPKRGEAMMWISWTAATLTSEVIHWAQNTLEWCPQDERNEKAGKGALKNIHECLNIFNQELSNKKFVLGDYSLVDAHMYSVLTWVRKLTIDFSAYQSINSWFERCSTRPAFKKVFNPEM
jgi:glutathione S-transferase